jgi:hypothetical protein
MACAENTADGVPRWLPPLQYNTEDIEKYGY